MGEVDKIAGRPAAAGLNPAMGLPNRVCIVVGIGGEILGPFQAERVLHPVVETLMVGPYAQQIISVLCPDLARNLLLATHRIQGHSTTLQAQHA